MEDQKINHGKYYNEDSSSGVTPMSQLIDELNCLSQSRKNNIMYSQPRLRLLDIINGLQGINSQAEVISPQFALQSNNIVKRRRSASPLHQTLSGVASSENNAPVFTKRDIEKILTKVHREKLVAPQMTYNPSMVRKFIETDRTEKEQQKRNINTVASRECRYKKKLEDYKWAVVERDLRLSVNRYIVMNINQDSFSC